MSIFMNFLEAYEHNVFEGGLNPGEQYTGKVNFSDGSLGLGTYGGLGGMATYNLLYHILNRHRRRAALRDPVLPGRLLRRPP